MTREDIIQAIDAWIRDNGHRQITGLIMNEVLKYIAENYEHLESKGVANGYAPLNDTGKIDADYLPSYVDDVVEYDSIGDFPATGESGIIYIAVDTGYSYRWSGSVYVRIDTFAAGNDGDVQYAKNGKMEAIPQFHFDEIDFSLQVGNSGPLYPTQTQAAFMNLRQLDDTNLDDSTSPNGHGFTDASIFDRTNNAAYACFDAQVRVRGTQDYDHIASFQARQQIESSGTIDRLTAFQSMMLTNTGVNRATGYEMRDLYGTGSANLLVALYIEALTKGAINAGVLQLGSLNGGSWRVGQGVDFSIIEDVTEEELLKIQNGIARILGKGVYEQIAGQYTPTVTAVDNVNSATPTYFYYIGSKNDNKTVIQISGRIDILPASANIDTKVRFSLPVVSTFGTTTMAYGTGFDYTDQVGADLYSDSSGTNEIILRFKPTTTGTRAVRFQVMYLVTS